MLNELGTCMSLFYECLNELAQCMNELQNLLNVFDQVLNVFPLLRYELGNLLFNCPQVLEATDYLLKNFIVPLARVQCA